MQYITRCNYFLAVYFLHGSPHHLSLHLYLIIFSVLPSKQVCNNRLVKNPFLVIMRDVYGQVRKTQKDEKKSINHICPFRCFKADKQY